MASCGTPDILDGDEPRGFWIRWKPGHGRLLVGRDGERLPFLMHLDDPLLPISHYAIRVEAGGSGSWRFPDEDEFSTSSSSSSSDDEDEEARAETKANSGQRHRAEHGARSARAARRWDRRRGYTRADIIWRDHHS